MYVCRHACDAKRCDMCVCCMYFVCVCVFVCLCVCGLNSIERLWGQTKHISYSRVCLISGFLKGGSTVYLI